MGPVGSQEGTSGSRMVPYGSVYESYIDTGQSSHPSGLVGGLAGHIGFRRVSVGTLFWHDGTQQGSTDRSSVLYWCTIDVRTHTGTYGGPTGSPTPHRDPTGPRRHRRTPFNRNLHSLGSPQLLLAQPWRALAMSTITQQSYHLFCMRVAHRVRSGTRK